MSPVVWAHSDLARELLLLVTGQCCALFQRRSAELSGTAEVGFTLCVAFGSQSLPHFGRLSWCRPPITRHCQRNLSSQKGNGTLRRLSAASATCESQQFRTVLSDARVLCRSEGLETVLPEVLPFSLQAGQTPLLVSAMACKQRDEVAVEISRHSCPPRRKQVQALALVRGFTRASSLNPGDYLQILLPPSIQGEDSIL